LICGKTTRKKISVFVKPNDRATSICDSSTERKPAKVAKITYGSVDKVRIKIAADIPLKLGTKAIQLYVKT
jgi:hypothetical protein